MVTPINSKTGRGGFWEDDALTATVCAVVALAWFSVGVWIPSLWADEAATASAVTRPWSDLLHLVGNIDAVHALHYAVVKIALTCLPVSEVALRLPSLLAAAGAVGVTYLVAREWWPRADALSAAAGLALLPRATWFSIEGRSWALTALLAVTATLLLIRWSKHPAPARLVPYVLVAGVGVVANIYLALLLAAHATTLLVLRTPWGRLVQWALGAAAGGLAGLPVVLAASAQRKQLGDRGDLSVTGWLTDVATKQFALGDTPGSLSDWVPRTMWLGAALVLAAVCWVLVLVSLRAALRPMPESRDARAMAAWTLPWVALPPLLLLVASLLGTNLYHPRYLSFTAPAFVLLVVAGLLQIRRGRVAVAILLVLLTLPVYASQRTPHAKAGYDYRDVGVLVAEESRPGDGVYFSPSPPTRMAALGYPRFFEGLDDFLLTQSPTEEGSLDGTSAPLTAEALASAPPVVWAVWSHRAAERPGDEATLRQASYRATTTWNGPESTVIRWER